MRRINLLSYFIVAIASALITYLIFGTTTDPVTPEPDSKNICMDYDAERMSTLDADLIHTMTRGYRKNQLDYIQTKTGTIAPEDAYSIWFDLITLKKYLYHIEKNSKKIDSTITDSKLGIRIYYAAYPDTTRIKSGEFKDLEFMKRDEKYNKYGGLHTLVMIPTITDDEGNPYDFNPLDKDTFSKGFYQDSKYSFGSSSTLPDHTAALSGTRDMAGKNHGTLYPPGPTLGMGF